MDRQLHAVAVQPPIDISAWLTDGFQRKQSHLPKLAVASGFSLVRNTPRNRVSILISGFITSCEQAVCCTLEKVRNWPATTGADGSRSHTSVCSAMCRASSTSIPRYRMVPSISYVRVAAEQLGGSWLVGKSCASACESRRRSRRDRSRGPSCVRFWRTFGWRDVATGALAFAVNLVVSLHLRSEL